MSNPSAKLYAQYGPDWTEVEIRGWWKDRLFVTVSDYDGGYLIELDRAELKTKRCTHHNGRTYFTPDGKEKEDAENAKTIAAGQMAAELYIYYKHHKDIGGKFVSRWEKQRVFNMNDRWTFFYWDGDETEPLEWVERKNLDSDDGAGAWPSDHTFYSSMIFWKKYAEEAEAELRALCAIPAEDAAALGITTDATEAQVIAAFRVKAKAAHPDKGGTTEAFQRISAAKDRALATLRRWAKAA